MKTRDLKTGEPYSKIAPRAKIFLEAEQQRRLGGWIRRVLVLEKTTLFTYKTKGEYGSVDAWNIGGAEIYAKGPRKDNRFLVILSRRHAFRVVFSLNSLHEQSSFIKALSSSGAIILGIHGIMLINNHDLIEAESKELACGGSCRDTINSTKSEVQLRNKARAKDPLSMPQLSSRMTRVKWAFSPNYALSDDDDEANDNDSTRWLRMDNTRDDGGTPTLANVPKHSNNACNFESDVISRPRNMSDNAEQDRILNLNIANNYLSSERGNDKPHDEQEQIDLNSVNKKQLSTTPVPQISENNDRVFSSSVTENNFQEMFLSDEKSEDICVHNLTNVYENIEIKRGEGSKIICETICESDKNNNGNYDKLSRDKSPLWKQHDNSVQDLPTPLAEVENAVISEHSKGSGDCASLPKANQFFNNQNESGCRQLLYKTDKDDFNDCSGNSNELKFICSEFENSEVPCVTDGSRCLNYDVQISEQKEDTPVPENEISETSKEEVVVDVAEGFGKTNEEVVFQVANEGNNEDWIGSPVSRSEDVVAPLATTANSPHTQKVSINELENKEGISLCENKKTSVTTEEENSSSNSTTGNFPDVTVETRDCCAPFDPVTNCETQENSEINTFVTGSYVLSNKIQQGAGQPFDKSTESSEILKSASREEDQPSEKQNEPFLKGLRRRLAIRRASREVDSKHAPVRDHRNVQPSLANNFRVPDTDYDQINENVCDSNCKDFNDSNLNDNCSDSKNKSFSVPESMEKNIESGARSSNSVVGRGNKEAYPSGRRRSLQEHNVNPLSFKLQQNRRRSLGNCLQNRNLNFTKYRRSSLCENNVEDMCSLYPDVSEEFSKINIKNIIKNFNGISQFRRQSSKNLIERARRVVCQSQAPARGPEVRIEENSVPGRKTDRSELVLPCHTEEPIDQNKENGSIDVTWSVSTLKHRFEVLNSVNNETDFRQRAWANNSIKRRKGKRNSMRRKKALEGVSRKASLKSSKKVLSKDFPATELGVSLKGVLIKNALNGSNLVVGGRGDSGQLARSSEHLGCPVENGAESQCCYKSLTNEDNSNNQNSVVISKNDSTYPKDNSTNNESKCGNFIRSRNRSTIVSRNKALKSKLFPSVSTEVLGHQDRISKSIEQTPCSNSCNNYGSEEKEEALFSRLNETFLAKRNLISKELGLARMQESYVRQEEVVWNLQSKIESLLTEEKSPKFCSSREKKVPNKILEDLQRGLEGEKSYLMTLDHHLQAMRNEVRLAEQEVKAEVSKSLLLK